MNYGDPEVNNPDMARPRHSDPDIARSNDSDPEVTDDALWEDLDKSFKYWRLTMR